MGKLEEAAPILEAYARDEPRDARGRAGQFSTGRDGETVIAIARTEQGG